MLRMGCDAEDLGPYASLGPAAHRDNLPGAVTSQESMCMGVADERGGVRAEPEGDVGERLNVANVDCIGDLDCDVPAGRLVRRRTFSWQDHHLQGSAKGPSHRGQRRVKLAGHSARDQDEAWRTDAHQVTGEGFCRYKQLIHVDEPWYVKQADHAR